MRCPLAIATIVLALTIASVKAFLVLRPGLEPSEALAKEIQEFAKREMAGYKYPRKIQFGLRADF